VDEHDRGSRVRGALRGCVDVEPVAWVGGGPFLGAFDADFPEVIGELHPGDKLVLATAAGDRLPELAGRHRRLPAHGLAYTLATETDGAVVVVEFAA
jgi:hypothetical protein